MGAGKVGGGRGELNSHIYELNTTKAETKKQYSIGWTVQWYKSIIQRTKLTLRELKIETGTSLVVQWLGTRLAMQGMPVQAPVGELRSHMLQGK